MKNTLFFFILLLAVGGYGQNLKGKITDLQGNPIEYASIYVSEIKTGCISSQTGEFILPLKAGTYTCIIQHLSYKTVTQTVQIPQETVLEIKMETQAIILKEVKIRSKDEDKAYRIIRNTVAKSPYYRKQLLSYKATFYSKGSMKIKDVPLLVGKLLEKYAKDINIRKGDVYTMESVNEIKVTPDKTEQRVISRRSSYPKSLQFDVADSYDYNIYKTDADDDFISPVTRVSTG